MVALVVALAAAYNPIFRGQIIFNRDLSRFLYPIHWFVGDSLRRADGPWWNPHVGLGHSMLADPQSAIFYPINLLHLAGPLPFMMNVVCLLHLVWGAVGMMKVARVFHHAWVPALITGMSWAMSGYVASLWTNGARLPSAAWMPWQILACVLLARLVGESKPASRAIAWLALATAAGMAAGDIFVAMMGCMLGLGLAGAWLLASRRSHDGPASERRWPYATTRRFVVFCLFGAGLGLLLAMAPILPAALAVQGTERAGGFTAAAAQTFSLHPMRVIEFAAPEAFSRAWYVASDAPWVRQYLDGSPLSLSTYLGGSVLALLFLAFMPVRRRGSGTAPIHDEPTRIAAGLVAAIGFFFLLLAFGRHTPVFAAVRLLIVPIRYMRSPEKFMLAVVPCVALLAGFGAHRLLQGSLCRPRTLGIALAALLLGSVLFIPFVLPAGLDGMVREQSWHGLLAAALLSVPVVLAARRTRLSEGLLVLLVLADLSTGATLTLRFESIAKLSEPPLAHALQRNTANPAWPFPRFFRGSKVQLSAGRSGELESDQITRETLRDNLSVPLGAAILPGYGVAIPPTFTAFIGQGRLDGLRLLAVDFALLSSPNDGAQVPEGLTWLSQPVPGVRLFKLDRALPRIFVATQGKPYPPSELPRHLLDLDIVSGRTVLLDEHVRWRPSGDFASSPVPCTFVHFRNTSVRALCDIAQPGLAIFVEQYAPGWRATVDGAPAPLFKANGLMRAVPVPAGVHAVELSYAPPGLALGVCLSLLGIGALVLLFVVAHRQERRCADPHRNTPSPGPKKLSYF